MNRKDFRPSNDYNSSSKKQYNPVKPKRDVVKAFIRGDSAHTSNDSLTSDGKTLYSYNTAIAVRQSDGNVVVNNTKYSSTTSAQQSLLMRELKDSNTKYDVTGGKDRGYQGEDFSEQVKKEQSEHPQLSKKEAETIVKQHQKLEHTTEKYHNHTIDVYETKTDRGHTEYKVYVDGNFTRTMSTKSNAENYGKTYIDSEYKNKPQGRMTLSEIKSENSSKGQYFFSPSTMKMYRQVNAKYRVKYDKKTDTNFVIVNMKKYPESNERKEVVYKYNKENGHLDIQ